MEVNKIIQGHTLDILRTLPDESVDCVVTSPPYWALRDYQTDRQIWDGDPQCRHEWNSEIKKWHGDRGKEKPKEIFDDSFQVQGTKHATCGRCGAWKGSLGLEPTFHLYIKHLCDIFDEAKRVLKKTGTCWVNIGDSYMGNSTGEMGENSQLGGGKKTQKEGGKRPDKIGLPDKCLCQIPSRFAIEMTNRGWILRNKIIWWKPNCMPSSAKDRFTVDFEEIFFFTKRGKYYFETQFEEFRSNDFDRARMAKARTEYGGKWAQESGGAIKTQRAFVAGNKEGRNKRCIWKINTKPFSEAHFATFPEELITTPIKAGCPEKGIVLDPFSGAGTTALVAKKLRRNYIGIELNKNYIDMANRRIAGTPTPMI